MSNVFLFFFFFFCLKVAKYIAVKQKQLKIIRRGFLDRYNLVLVILKPTSWNWKKLSSNNLQTAVENRG